LLFRINSGAGVFAPAKVMAMVITNRARLLALCAMLALPSLGGALADPAIKPAITGLISTGSPTNTLDEFTGRAGILGGVVIQATWADLEPTQPAPNGPVTLVTTAIDNALTAVANYNLAAATMSPPNNRQIGVRLRVFSGCTAGVSDAPTWALSLDGSPINVTAQYNGAQEACSFGRFWDPTSAHAAAWRQFQTALAAAYDTQPLVQEVAITSCTSYSAEPFFLPYTGTGDTVQAVLQQNGYTDDQYQQCLANAVADYASWQTTRLEFTFNPFNGLTAQNNVAFSGRVMRECRQAAGLRCILSNHDLDTQTPSAILPLYALMRKFGPSITAQTLYTTPTDYEGTLRKGISLGAGAIEVWPKGFKTETNATLENWALMFVPQ
jgi:hypothetical protein